MTADTRPLSTETRPTPSLSLPKIVQSKTFVKYKDGNTLNQHRRPGHVGRVWRDNPDLMNTMTAPLVSADDVVLDIDLMLPPRLSHTPVTRCLGIRRCRIACRSWKANTPHCECH